MHVMRAVRPTNAPSSSAGTSDAPVESSADAARAELDRRACAAEQKADTWAFGCLLTRLALHQLHHKVSQKAAEAVPKEKTAGIDGEHAVRPGRPRSATAPVCGRNGLRTLRRHVGEPQAKGSGIGAVAAAATDKAKERRRAQLQRKKTDGDLEGWDA